MLTPVSVKASFTVDVISGIFLNFKNTTRFKAVACRSPIYYKGIPLQNFSWKFSKIWNLRNLVWRPFLIAFFTLQTLCLQFRLNGNFSKFLEEILSGRYRCTRTSLWSVENTNIFLLKGNFITGTLPVILEFFVTLIEKICVGVSFQYSYPWVHAWLSCNLVCNIIIQQKYRCYKEWLTSKVWKIFRSTSIMEFILTMLQAYSIQIVTLPWTNFNRDSFRNMSQKLVLKWIFLEKVCFISNQLQNIWD